MNIRSVIRGMIVLRGTFGTAFLALVLAGPLAAQEEPASPTIKLGAGRSLELEGQIQVQGASSSVDSVATWDSELRRVRLTAIADAGGGFFGTLQTDFGAERARVRDAFLEYRPSTHFALRLGQFKIPFNGIELVSSKRLLVIERGNRIRGLRADHTSTFLEDNNLAARNRGFMVTARFAEDRLTLMGGGWTGSGENPERNDGKELAARIEYSVLPLPERTSRPLIVGAAAVTNGYFGSPGDTLRVVDGDSLRLDGAEYTAAFEAWVEYGKYLVPGIHVAGNVIFGDNPQQFNARGSDVEFESFLGLQGWGELLVQTGRSVLTGWAPAFRADRFDPDSDADDDASLLLTPGLNLYFGPNVKLQLNVDVNIPQSDDLDTETAFRTQAQLLF
jgi:Phosphate-selective porin O and P